MSEKRTEMEPESRSLARVAELRSTISSADAKRDEFKTRLKELRGSIVALESERRDIAIGSVRAFEIGAEIDRLQKEVATYSEALKTVERIKVKAEIGLKSWETLAAFDVKAGEIVEVSTAIGKLAAEFSSTFEDAMGKASELEELARAAMPQEAQVRWRGQMREPLDATTSHVHVLMESSTAIAEFVKNRIATLRSEIATALGVDFRM
jgi:chromosome segregation ATPase